jgi:hypothetical protein
MVGLTARVRERKTYNGSMMAFIVVGIIRISGKDKIA